MKHIMHSQVLIFIHYLWALYGVQKPFIGIFHSKSVHIGVTATPNRTDKKLLGEVYDEVSYEKDILDFIPDYLSDLKIVRRESGIVLDGVKKSVNDLNCNDLSDCLNTEDGNKFVVDTWQEVASDRKSTLVFCADIAHTQGLAKEFRERGIQAWSIDSTMDMEYRRGVLAAFHAGKTQVLLNCGILTEGFDCPQIDCVLLVRPTRSELLLRQMIGRGTRLYPEKENCLILDIACVSNNWDLITPTKLFGAEPVSIDSVAKLKEESEERQTSAIRFR